MNNKFYFGAMAAMSTVLLCSFVGSSDPSGSQARDNKNLLSIVEDIPTAQAFKKDAVPQADLQRIVNAGINAPSAMNRQPWHFTVITNAETIQKLADIQKSSMQNMKFPPRPDGKNDGKKDDKNRPEKPAKGERPTPPDGQMPPFPGGQIPANGERPTPPAHHGPHAGLGDSPVVIFISCKPGSEFDAGLACESMNDMANLLGYGTKIASSVTMLFNGDKKDELNSLLQVPDGQKVVTAILLGKVDTDAYDATTSATQRNSADQVVTYLK